MDSTLLKGLDILEKVACAPAPLSVSELARDTGLPKSNIHRTLSTLTAAGFVLHDPQSRRYAPSLKLVLLGQTVGQRFSYQRALEPYLLALAAQTGESACFAVRSGTEVLFVTSQAPNRPLAAIVQENLRLSSGDTAFGQVLDPAQPLAHALLDDHPARHTFELAVPLRYASGALIGAIGLVGPSSRFDPARVPFLLGVLNETCEKARQGTGADGLPPAREPGA